MAFNLFGDLKKGLLKGLRAALSNRALKLPESSVQKFSIKFNVPSEVIRAINDELIDEVLVLFDKIKL